MGIRELGYIVGEGEAGTGNRITDVPGVKVGHATIDRGDTKTGVTVILPCGGMIYDKKPVAACYALNGFGKTAGTVQMEELGVLETPIALTNTLNVGKVADALVEYTCLALKKEGRCLTSVNPVVGETNDSRINRIDLRAVETEHVLEALEHASEDFLQGDIGAGKGTVCFGLKGGIGSSSRIFRYGGKEYVVGILVQSNFGRMQDFTLLGQPIGRQISERISGKEEVEKGSIMIVMGTDIPLSSRQVKRVLKRAAVGMVRTGSYMGHGSGDVFIGFSNANTMPVSQEETINTIECLPENKLDGIFRLAAEAAEEAILNSMVYADSAFGRDGQKICSLREFL